MDKEHVKGAAKKVEGSIKEAAGTATGNDKLKNQGRADKAEGHIRSAVGDVKDAARDVGKSARK
jgi:uncharacterized protein YjbJ (UPF0337 family)